MSKQKKIKLLCTAADRELLQPILEALWAKGLRVQEAKGEISKDDVLLAVLSESFFADSDAVKCLLNCVAAGAEKENILPLQLDGTAMPAEFKNALYSRNIIPATGRDAAHTAERIYAALPEIPNRLPWVLGTAALVLVAVIGVFVWRAAQNRAEPVMAETVISVTLPQGLTMEDLEKIEAVCIIGEDARFYTAQEIVELGYYIDWDEFAYRDWYDDEAHWFSREDGHEYTRTRYDDLSFLGLMPNLRMLHLNLIEAGTLPDLSGATKLDAVSLMESVLPDLNWLAGASVRHLDIINSTGSITDFSPLTKCEKLREVHIDLVNTRQADLGGFAPPKLDWLWINNGSDLQGALDLSALSGCTRLRECSLQYCDQITDLNFLPKTAPLQRLQLTDLHALRDISALNGMSSLTSLTIDDCSALRDYSPIGGCSRLEDIMLYPGWDERLRDVSFLTNCIYLKEIQLYSVELPDLNFLRGASATQDMNQTKLQRLEFSGTIGDYSDLALFEKYEYLSLDSYDGNVAQMLPYLEGVTISNLTINRATELDLSALPTVTGRLLLSNVDRLTDLSTMPEDFAALRLAINNCPSLRSLEGLQKQSKIGKGFGDLEIYNCPRLTDFSVLEGMKLSTLSITGGFVVPELSELSLGLLRLDSVADVTDINFVDCLDDTRPCSFELIGLDELRDLTPLRRMRGSYLAVPPQLAEQAEELVNDKLFGSYRIEYPQGGWDNEDYEFTLLSLDELETLPKSMLRHVTSLFIAGDQLINEDRFDVWEDWDRWDANGTLALVLYDRETGEESTLGSGVIKDFSALSELSGLNSLKLWGQPIENLDGIQNFSQLKNIDLRCCYKLTDASPIFAIQSLDSVTLSDTGISSIQGVQNLPGLVRLNINNTEVKDLTPLAGCDFSTAYKNGGLELNINELDLGEEDFAALGAVRSFSNLDFTDAEPAIWIPALADCEIYRLGAAGDLRSNEDLAAFAADHPELQSLWLGWIEEITDLTCLLPLENLEQVSVNRDMEEAIASLDGLSYGFELEIND